MSQSILLITAANAYDILHITKSLQILHVSRKYILEIGVESGLKLTKITLELTKDELLSIIVHMSAGCPTLHTAFIHKEDYDSCKKLQAKLRSKFESINH